MVRENHEFEEDQQLWRDRCQDTAVAAETLRSAAEPATRKAVTGKPAAVKRPACGEKISLFWQIFGGTVVSVIALMAITAFTQLSGNANDLRRDLNQVQVDLVRKDDLNARLSALWAGVKDLQATTASRVSLEAHTRVLNRDLGARIKADDDLR